MRRLIRGLLLFISSLSLASVATSKVISSIGVSPVATIPQSTPLLNIHIKGFVKFSKPFSIMACTNIKAIAETEPPMIPEIIGAMRPNFCLSENSAA